MSIIKFTNETIIKAFCSALSKDEKVKKFLTPLQNYHPPTYEHTLRVCEVATDIFVYGPINSATQTSSETYVPWIIYGALLHDVGKLKVPLDILDKKEKLEEVEINVIKSHAYYLRELLADFKPQEAVDVALGSHEWNNHHSYPRNEARQNGIITELSQILAAADIADSLFFPRPYNVNYRTYTKEKIAKIIKKDFKGKQEHVDEVLLRYQKP